ncbi:hypothetical protein JCM10207_000236 [Rhodosporidiobolus poonsookiae]
MLTAATARATTRAARVARPPLRTPRSSISTLPVRRPQHLAAPWKVAGAVGAAALAYAAWEFKPEWVPTPAPLSCDAPPAPDTYLDPTTSTPFPSTLVSPDGVKLRLVGTGVRTVSIFSIRVYTVGFYCSERELQLAEAGKLAGWEGYTPERLIPPYTVPGGQPTGPVGEELMDSLFEKADAAVVIVPLRNTSLTHLRDAFTRTLIARMKIPRVAQEMEGELNEQTGAALVEFKSFFSSKNLQKGSPLTLFYSAPNRTVLFQAQDEKTRVLTTLGVLRQPLLAKELLVSYFSDSAAPSPEMVKSAAMGFGGAGRP